MSSKITHGGARTGAGRKPISNEPRSATLSVRITPSAKDAIVKASQAKGVTISTLFENFANSLTSEVL